MYVKKIWSKNVESESMSMSLSNPNGFMKVPVQEKCKKCKGKIQIRSEYSPKFCQNSCGP